MREKGPVVFLFAVALGFAAVSKGAIAEEGSHAAEFLSHGVGARALGMGSSFVSIADDATAAYWNPAGLVQIPTARFCHDVFRFFRHRAVVASSVRDW